MPSAVSGVVGGLFGSSKTPSAPNVQTWVPSNISGADTSFTNLINSMTASNPYQQYAPYAQTTFGQGFNNPYAGGYQASADTAGTAYGNVGNMATGNANALSTAAGAALPAASSVLTMGFDPQSDLYRRTLQQLTDSINVNQAGRGITDSPYGASIADNAISNFNIDWQNNQLQRALQALSGYTTGVGNTGNIMSTAENLGTAGANAFNNAGAVPFNASNTIIGSRNTALQNLLQVLGNPGSGAYQNINLGNLLGYMQLGADQSNAQGDFSLKNYANQLAAAQNASAGLGGLAGGITSLLNGGQSSGFGGILNTMLPSASSIFSSAGTAAAA